VILTGSKNNAGDYLIKYRAKQLFQSIRPDRAIVDFNAWETLDEAKLEKINQAKALILTGGPAVQQNMYPNIYRLTPDLNKIKVPLLTMGVGWKSPKGDWKDTHDYPLSSSTQALFKQVEGSGYQSSVRDYHTLNALKDKGFNQFIMTGCPALYDLDHVNASTKMSKSFDRISFSLGVTFAQSKQMERSVKELILQLQKLFAGKELTVVFHHGTKAEDYKKAYGKLNQLFSAQQAMIKWLEKHNINMVDIAGGAEKMVAHYNEADFHIGYRVHAHIFMSSISKPSILIAEDGRGKALQSVLNGLIFNGFDKTYSLGYFLDKNLKKYFDFYKANQFLTQDVINNITYELENDLPRLSKTRVMIDNTYHVMESFLKQLP